MLKLAISTLLLGFSVAALCDDSKFSFNGKLMKPNKDYQYPPKIKIAWFNVLEGDDSDRPWRWCGGESLIFGDEFAYTMEMNREMFDKNISTDPAVLQWWADIFNVPEDEMSKIKFTRGEVFGHYGNDIQCGFRNDMFDPLPGPNGELAMSERYMIFYRNGYWPGPGLDDECSFIDWTSKIPQGFSCGLAVAQPNGCGYKWQSVDCLEVIIKVATPRDCSDGDFGDDCFDFAFWE